MERNIKAFTLSSLLFFCISSLPFSFSGVYSLFVRILSCILPFATALFIGDRKEKTPLPIGNIKKSLTLLPAFPIALLLVFLLSLLTTFLLGLAGAYPHNPLGGNVNIDLLYHGIVPALTEEIFFRLLPLIIIAPYSKRTAIVISTLFFSLAHTSLFSIPYALLAGVIFITLDLLADSVLPSVMLHLINNFLSVFYMYFALTPGFTYLFFGVLGLLTSISIGVIFILRGYYINMFKEAFSEKDSVKIPLFTLAFILPMLAFTALNLF